MAFPEPQSGPRKRLIRISYENRLFIYALMAGAAPAIVAAWLLWRSGTSPQFRWGILIVLAALWFGFATAVRSTVVRSLRTLANMQAAVREGDFSIRARSTGLNDSLSEVMYEINELASTLHDQRLDAFEAGALMRKVLTEIDVAVFTFDAQRKLRLANRAAERLIGQVSERAIGKTAESLGVSDLLESDDAHTVDRSFPGGSGRWGIRRSTFRQGGVTHQLLVVTELSRALREEERQAWQRLVRVLGHELNNSLAPIKSIAQSLQSLFRRESRPADWEDDVARGLSVISDRSEALARFIADYSRLARLPKPNLQSVSIAPMLRRIVSLDTRIPVSLADGRDVTIEADPDQLEQLLINILRNAVDASAGTGGKVEVAWDGSDDALRITIADQGCGIANPANLFVPFFTTKPGGSGIGLALSRQIAEAHHGEVTLANRNGSQGCVATIVLPRTQT